MGVAQQGPERLGLPKRLRRCLFSLSNAHTLQTQIDGFYKIDSQFSPGKPQRHQSGPVSRIAAVRIRLSFIDALLSSDCIKKFTLGLPQFL